VKNRDKESLAIKRHLDSERASFHGNASSALAGDGHVFVAAGARTIGASDFIGLDPAIGGNLGKIP
jgi:hypothetical protein